ncbi:uncharacterized protein LOC133814962 [Humulus lupulus]|uniref:uncharacterized protein LOC133814962 n=1 Tax=Humulus lupulus TaxID=3486 RepID=UPI002B407E48|nr:uncharacterized protein LOC133814962 [Humulus lupulus]
MDCDLIISKIRKTLHGWASRNLSYAGRVQLIQSILLGIRNFWMSTFLLPQKVIKEIDCLCRIFLWGGNGFRSKFHLASWDHVCRRKSYGGLGFKEGVLWNKINLTRYVWAISSKQDSLWVKWVNCIYLKGVRIWDYVLHQDASWCWKKLVKVSKLLSEAEINAAVCQGKIRLNNLYLHFISGSPSKSLKNIWCKLSVPKHRFILWQAFHQKLLTKDLLHHYNIPVITLSCPVYETEMESHAHLFFDCLFSRKVLQAVAKWLGSLMWPRQFQEWCCWLEEPSKDDLARVVVASLVASVYFIWKNRNKCWVESCCFSVAHVDVLIRNSVKTRVNNLCRRSKRLTLREKLMINFFSKM